MKRLVTLAVDDDTFVQIDVFRDAFAERMMGHGTEIGISRAEVLRILLRAGIAHYQEVVERGWKEPTKPTEKRGCQ